MANGQCRLKPERTWALTAQQVLPDGQSLSSGHSVAAARATTENMASFLHAVLSGATTECESKKTPHCAGVIAGRYK